MELSGTAYLWIKALHIISVIAWMAGLLYLPRLFVYHAQVAVGSEASETFKIMERRLLRAIMNPAMIASFFFGAILFEQVKGWTLGWALAKLALALGLAGAHMAMASWVKAFAQDRNLKSQKFFRAFNEVPTLLMIGIVILAVLRPF